MTPTLEQLALPTSRISDFIAFYEAIPDELWWAGGGYSNPIKPECQCAFGLLGYESGKRGASSRLYKLKGKGPLTAINDGENPQYPQLTPKARVLAFLRDCEKKEV